MNPMMTSDQKPAARKKKILIFEGSFALSEHLLKLWIEIAQESVKRTNRFTVALSGGRTPMEFYCKLSTFKDFDLWQRTHVFLGDERLVPPDDERCNYKMIKENLLDYVNIPPENVHPIPVDQRSVELAADHYASELSRFFEFKENKAPRFDLILLGVGPDGHVASLFDNDPNINDPNRLVLPISLPQLKEDRVSLSLPVINNARNITVLALGANKAEIIRKVIMDKSNIPATKVDPSNGQLTYLLDKDAAKGLAYKDSYVHEGQAILYDTGI